jgi:hypothetical protein
VSEKPIYVDRGNGNFERYLGTLADLGVLGWPDFFPEKLPPGTSSAGPAADHVYYNDSAPADLLTMSSPTAEMWADLARFIEKGR